MSVSRQFHAAIAAIQFLTRVPLPGGMNWSGADVALLREAIVYYPLVGGVIGVFTGAVVLAALLVWPPIVAVALGLIAEALLTGALHEDAVADSCDAFGGGWTRDDVLRILKDSRIGSFGALGLTLAILVRGGCLLSVPGGALIATVAASAAIGRWGCMVMKAAVSPVPGREGLAKDSDLGERLSTGRLLWGSLLMVLAVTAFAWIEPVRAALGVAAAVVGVLCWAFYVRWRIGGLTGDSLGCGCYLAQCLFLLAAIAAGGQQ
jgi:adenosylcobinamide-GDP ribazoletransferase